MVVGCFIRSGDFNISLLTASKSLLPIPQELLDHRVAQASHFVPLPGYNASAGRLAHLLPGLDQSLLSSPPADPWEMLKIVLQITVSGFKMVLPYHLLLPRL